MLMVEDAKTRMEGRIVPRDEWPAEYLKPIAPTLSELVSRPALSCSLLGSWYVVCTEARQEQIAKSEIGDRGLVPYLPIEPRRERHGRGQMRTVERPLMPSYLLVKCEPEDWHKVTSARGVRRLLGIGAAPRSLPDAAVEVIRLREAELWEAEAHRREVEEAAERAKAGGRSGVIWHFSAGDRVRIKAGPCAMFYADLVSAVDGHDRVNAVIKLFGQVWKTELSAFNIEPASADEAD